MKTIVPGIYTHYKGNKYEVLGIATRESDLKPVVIYKTLYSAKDFPQGTIFTRPLDEFTELVLVEGKNIPRFKFVVNSFFKITPSDIFKLAWFPFAVFMISYYISFDLPVSQNTFGIDSYLHFFGGVSIAYSAHHAINILKRNNILEVKNVFFKALQIISVVALAAVLWEIWEYWHDATYGTLYQPNLANTMWDMIIGLGGGAVFALLSSIKKPVS